MSEKELAELPTVSPLSAGALLYVVDGDGNSRKVTVADLAQLVKTLESIVPESEPFRGALVVRTSNQAISATTDTFISWQDASYDTDSVWSGGVPTRLTVPAGVSRVRVGFGFLLDGASTAFYADIRKNGAAFAGMPSLATASSHSGGRASMMSAVLSVTPGDYFESLLYLGAARNVVAGAYTWMSMEIVEVQP